MSDKDLFKAVRQYEKLGEVVTCGECKYYEPYNWQSNNGECTYSDEHERAVCCIDYCSKGVRKDGETE
jgi:hypothetical protein